MTTVAIHQPQYLPWAPYLDKADNCDTFVFLDNVQYQKNSFQNRNVIKSAKGPVWLTVPVHADLTTPINAVQICGWAWQRKHLRTIGQNYARARSYPQYAKVITEFMEVRWDSLVELNIAMTEWLFSAFNIDCKLVRASSLEVEGKGDDLVLAICRAVGADVYLSGQGAKAYQDADKFVQAGITLNYQEYSQHHYRQCYPATGFLPHLSAIDLLLNEGPRAAALLRQAD